MGPVSHHQPPGHRLPLLEERGGAWGVTVLGWGASLASPFPPKTQNCFSQASLPCRVLGGKLCKVALKGRARGQAGAHRLGCGHDLAAAPSPAETERGLLSPLSRLHGGWLHMEAPKTPAQPLASLSPAHQGPFHIGSRHRTPPQTFHPFASFPSALWLPGYHFLDPQGPPAPRLSPMLWEKPGLPPGWTTPSDSP